MSSQRTWNFVVAGRRSAAIGYEKDFRKSYLCLHSYNLRRACSYTWYCRASCTHIVALNYWIRFLCRHLSKYPKLLDTNRINWALQDYVFTTILLLNRMKIQTFSFYSIKYYEIKANRNTFLKPFKIISIIPVFHILYMCWSTMVMSVCVCV